MPAFPPGWTRTASHLRKRAQFDRSLTLARAYQDLLAEIRRLGAGDLRVDHDLRTYVADPMRPISGQRQPDDPGVVVYFTLRGRKIALACDKWDRAEHNLRAIAYTLEAKRAVERYGCASQEAEYRGYEALPPLASQEPEPDPYEVLGVARGAAQDVVDAAYRALAKRTHPDTVGGSTEAFQRLQRARERIQEERSVAP